MKKRPPEHWATLGRYVQRQRLPIESDMREWSAKVRRSTRTLEGLERGEQVGPKTITLVAGGLGVDPDVLFGILESGVAGANSAGPATPPRSLKDRTYTGDAELVREHVVQWYLSAPAEKRSHAIDLLITFLRAHPHGGDEGD